jgi:hypothetical protein
MTRDERVHAMAKSIMAEIQVEGLRRLADETARAYRSLHDDLGLPHPVVRAWFDIAHDVERLRERR